MAHFYGILRGSRSPATRCGTKTSGLTASARGWDIGARIEARHYDYLGDDTIELYLDGGSNGLQKEVFLGEFDADSLEILRKIDAHIDGGVKAILYSAIASFHAYEKVRIDAHEKD